MNGNGTGWSGAKRDGNDNGTGTGRARDGYVNRTGLKLNGNGRERDGNV